MGVKRLLTTFSESLGFRPVSVNRFGFEVEYDLARLCGQDEPKTILDIGANKGQSLRRFRRVFQDCQIYSFEPVPETYQILKAAAFNLGRVETFNCAMGAAPGSAEIWVSGTAGNNSMIHKGEPSDARPVQIEVTTVDHFCRQKAIRAIDILKMDVEGYELNVLEGATGMLRDGKIRYIYSECEFASGAEPHANFFQLNDLLFGMGYCIVSFYAESFSLSHGSCLGNALFAKRDLLPATVAGPVKNIF